MANTEVPSNGSQSEGAAENPVENVVIIGSGPSGFTAGVYTAGGQLDPPLFTRNDHGGPGGVTYEGGG